MRNKITALTTGIIFIFFGGLLLGNIIWDWDVFFDGWWTLFIIVPCAISLLSSGVHAGNLIALSIGVLLLLSEQDFIDYNFMWKMIFPIVFVSVGISIIIKSLKKQPSVSEDFSSRKHPKNENATAIFGGSEPNFRNVEFKGITSTAIFGGVDLNLKTAIIKEDCEISATAIFGGIDIVLPPNVKVILISTPILGGVDNKYVSSLEPDAPTVTINATCIFGGLDIK